MAYTFAINQTTQDLSITSDRVLQTISGAEEITQRVVIALKHFHGEYFLNTEHGVLYDEAILGQKDLSLVEAVLRNEILSVPGVSSIEAFTLYMFARSLTIKCTFLTQNMGLQSINTTLAL